MGTLGIPFKLPTLFSRGNAHIADKAFLLARRHAQNQSLPQVGHKSTSRPIATRPNAPRPAGLELEEIASSSMPATGYIGESFSVYQQGSTLTASLPATAWQSGWQSSRERERGSSGNNSLINRVETRTAPDDVQHPLWAALRQPLPHAMP